MSRTGNTSKRNRCEPRRTDKTSIPLNVLPEGHQVSGKVRASRMGWRRAGVLIAVHVLMIIHIIQWRMTGRTVSPIEPSESMYTIRDGAINAGFIFFVAALLATALLGRFVCGWGCHFVALQDLCGTIMRRLGVRPKAFRSRLLVFVPLIAGIYLFIWPAIDRILFKPDHTFPGFSNHLIKTRFWETFPGWAIAVPFVLVCGFGVVYFLGAKGYCTYACPYGGFFGLTDKVAVGRIRVTDDCEQCGHCTAVCTSNVMVHAEVRDYGMVVDPGCMKCMDCVSVCPNDALYYGFGKASLTAKPKKAPQPRKYDLTWPEEILAAVLFLASFLAYRGLAVTRAEGIPFLMSLGMAGIFTYLVIKAIHVLRRPTTSIQNLRLRSGRKLTLSGVLFLVVFLGSAALTAHAGLVQYHRYAGDYAFDRTGGADENALVDRSVLANVSDHKRAAADVARDHYQKYLEYGWVDVGETRSRLAWIALIDGRRDDVIAQLRRAVELAPDEPSYRFYWGAALMGSQRYPDAADVFTEYLKRFSSNEVLPRHWINAQLNLANANAELGLLDEAMAGWRTLLLDHPELVIARHNLAGALRTTGQLDEAVKQYQMALETAPNDANLHFQLGVTLSQMGQPSLASPHLERAIVLDARFADLIEGPANDR